MSKTDLAAAFEQNTREFLHGAPDESEAALERMVAPVTDGALFGGACGYFAEISADALRDLRAQAPRKVRDRPFGLHVPDGTPAPIAAAAQFVVATANRDKDMALALVMPWAKADADRDGIRLMLLTLARFARVHHNFICQGDERR